MQLYILCAGAPGKKYDRCYKKNPFHAKICFWFIELFFTRLAGFYLQPFIVEATKVKKLSASHRKDPIFARTIDGWTASSFPFILIRPKSISLLISIPFSHLSKLFLIFPFQQTEPIPIAGNDFFYR